MAVFVLNNLFKDVLEDLKEIDQSRIAGLLQTSWKRGRLLKEAMKKLGFVCFF